MSEISNISNILGDHNINLQNITAQNIQIITGKEENPEVTAKKQEIAAAIVQLIRQLDTKNKSKDEVKTNATVDDFDNVNFDDLIDAIKFDNCILFIGPEISVDENGKSIHEKFYQSISSKNAEYQASEGFFEPNSETKLINKMKRFYTETFHHENKSGYEILEKLAQIPFNLIVSAAPDDTLHRIFDSHNKKHNFLYYNEAEQTPDEPDKENPVIFNFLGNPAINGKFIFTF